MTSFLSRLFSLESSDFATLWLRRAETCPRILHSGITIMLLPFAQTDAFTICKHILVFLLGGTFTIALCVFSNHAHPQEVIEGLKSELNDARNLVVNVNHELPEEIIKHSASWTFPSRNACLESHRWRSDMYIRELGGKYSACPKG